MSVRDEWMEQWCHWLAAIIYYRHAPHEVGPDDQVVTLPLWWWATPRIDVGAKATSPDGQPMLMPVRITWDSGSTLVLPPGRKVEVKGRVRGMGHAQEAVARISTRARMTECDRIVTLNDHKDANAWGIMPHVTGTGIEALNSLKQAAHESEWGARMTMDKHVRKAVDRAVAIVSADVLLGDRHRNTHPEVLDEVAKADVADEILLGDQHHGGTNPGAISRLIDRATQPEAFTSVDPTRYIRTDIERTAVAYVRRKIGDPPIGSKIRRVHRDMPGASIDEIIAAYNDRHPADRLSVSRAARALTSGRHAMAYTVPYNPDAEPAKEVA